jgi:aspartate racemase
MKTLGLVGGTGWVSTVEYYRLINQGIHNALGGHEFARCILYSLNFGDILAGDEKKDSEGVFTLIRNAVHTVVRGGAEGVILCANTLHKFVDRIEKDIDVPIIHIAEATARAIHDQKLSKVGLLGTLYTMEQDFYISKLKAAKIETIIPEKSDREFIQAVIYNELLLEIFTKKSKKRFLEIMKKIQQDGAEGIILGCTEIPLLIHEDDFNLPLFNTTEIHARAAVDFALGK